MAQFSYEARTREGSKEIGLVDAKTQSEAARQVQDMGLRVISIKKKEGKKSSSIFAERIKVVDKIFFTQNLYIMVRTGFSLAQALKTLALQATNKRFRGIIEAVSSDIEKGQSLSKALMKYPKVFNELFVNMIAAGEISGKLEEVLQQLTLQMKKDHALLAKIKSALTYPIIIVVAMLVIGTGLIVFVIPQITSVFAQAEAELPLPTRILIGLSEALQNYGIFMILGLAFLVFLYVRFLKTQKGKHIIHKLMLKTPVFGEIIRKVNIARFTRNLSSLLKTDIPIVQTFSIIGRTLGNIYYREAMQQASEDVKKGINIVKVLERYPNLFPPILIQMVSVGEQSGTLELIAEEIATFYEEDVDQTMTTLPTIIEPILMLLIGAAAGALVAAIILPIYSLSDAI